jgi:regulator of protease activity HflC (stomatin/prohibitin superfamily)
MFGLTFVKFQPTDYVLQYKNGQLVRAGAGLSFIYFTLTSSLVRIPISSVDVPFIFAEVTADFQEITIQGQITYKITDPNKLSQLMNFTLAANGKSYSSDDPEKLPLRLINNTQVLTRALLKTMPLKKVLISSDELVKSLILQLQGINAINSLGIEILDVSITAIKPTPEMTRALEAEAREQILLLADEAIYARRNAAVEQERIIKENELNTDIAVEQKKRQIRETQMEAQKAIQQKERELKEAEMTTKIVLEQQNAEWVALASKNARLQADDKAYSTTAIMQAFANADPKIIQALATTGMNANQLIASAFRELAEGAEKIGQLNISPDLLSELMQKEQPQRLYEVQQR